MIEQYYIDEEHIQIDEQKIVRDVKSKRIPIPAIAND